ncbi:hypothetical protein [Peribacillus sp. SCS-155]|uniref:hypothetical protein n=1 Tax=Peribacillus sedimenti TaxID=3115297 RepID=UPI003905D9ED
MKRTNDDIFMELMRIFIIREEQRDVDGVLHTSAEKIAKLLNELKANGHKDDYKFMKELNEDWIESELERKAKQWDENLD